MGTAFKDISSEITDSGITSGICEHGHSRTLVLGNAKFEILFEIGLCAIHDGYYREAVLSFYSAVECFYEFWLRCILRSRSTPQNVMDSALNEIRLSERQLGAFIFTYYAEFGCSPNLPSSGWTNVRNDVAHKGEIPSNIKAINFGQTAYKLLNRLKNELISKFPNEVSVEMEQVFCKAMKIANQKDSQYYYSTVSAKMETVLEEDFEKLARRAWTQWRLPRSFTPISPPTAAE